MQAVAYIILCLSETLLPRADILTGLIVLTSPHERSADPIPIILEVNTKHTKPRTLVYGKVYL